MKHFVKVPGICQSGKFFRSLSARSCWPTELGWSLCCVFDSPLQKSVTFSPFCFPSRRNLHHFFLKKTKKNDSETYSARQTSRDKNDFGVSLRLSVSLENCELFLLCNMFKNQKKKKESVVCLGEDVFEVTSVKYQRTENTGGWVQAPLDFFF